VIATFEAPTGPGVRVDSFGYAGYRTSPRFDSLLAKLIAHAPSRDFSDAVRRTARALAEFRIEGVQTNIPFLRATLGHPDLVRGAAHTRFIDEHAADLVNAMPVQESPASGATGSQRGRAGAAIDRSDPLAVLAYGKAASVARSDEAQSRVETAPDGMVP